MRKFTGNTYSIIQVLLSNFFTKGIIGILTLIIIRYMDYNEYASYTFMISMGGLISGVFVASINNIYISGYQKLGMQQKEACFMPLQCMLCIFGVVILYFLYNLTLVVSLTVLLFCLTTCLSEFMKTIYQQRLKFGAYNRLEIGRIFLYAAFLLVYLYLSGCNMKSVDVVLINAIAFGGVGSFCIKNNDLKIYKKIMYQYTIYVIHEICYSEYKFLFLYMVVLAVMGQVNVLVLKELGSDFELASYGVAYQFYNIYILVLGAINTVFFPGIVKAIGKEEINKYFRLQKKISLIMIPLVCIFDLITVLFIQNYFEGKYNTAIPVFLILSILAVISVAMSPYMSVVFKFDRYKQLSFYTTCIFVIYCIGSIFLFNKFNIVGLSISMLSGYSAINIYGYNESRKLISKNYE